MNKANDIVEIEKIRKLRALYSYHFDSRNLDKLISLFTDDAVCEFSEEFGGSWVGIDAIRENYKIQLDRLGKDWSTVHAITNHVIDIEGDSASGQCYLLDYIVSSESNPLFAIAVYYDDYKKVENQWRIHRTRLDFHWMNPGLLK